MSIRTERINFFRQTVLDFLEKSGRSELPWRKKKITPYEVWVSEVMLQQTQVSRVIDYYRRFLKRFPTVEKLAQAHWEAFLPYYEGLGYYARGRNMLRTAEAVVKEYEGRFPRTVSELEQLPGIGPYTARAIASFAYDASELAWDTNLKRVLGRFFFGGKDRVGEEEMIMLNKALGKGARELNAALMDFGSALCAARPKCANCPLQKRCQYFKDRGKQELGALVKKAAGSQKKGDQSLVFLHERHQRYFSSQTKHYRPFLLPPGYLTRAAIKEFFLKEYSLSVAVRPPHSVATLGGVSVSLVHAQILLGEPSFSVFPKSAVVEYTEREKL
jgi:A/G-specific adenine glycosylase